MEVCGLKLFQLDLEFHMEKNVVFALDGKHDPTNRVQCQGSILWKFQ